MRTTLHAPSRGRDARRSWTFRQLWAAILISSSCREVLGASHSPPVHGCKTYEPGECVLAHGDGPARVPYCHKGDGVSVQCSFDTELLTQCPLPARGEFKTVLGDACNNPFMAARNSGSPSCGPHCCAATHLQGGFAPSRWQHLGRQIPTFRPHNGSCSYHDYTWRQALSCLAGTKLVIAGDSVMRQVFNAGIAMFRGQVAIDYNKHAHGRYRVCEAADSLEFGTFEPKRFEIPLSEITQVFGPASAGPEQCLADATFDLDYLWAPRFMDLTPFLLEFHNGVISAESAHNKEQLAYVVFAGFWEDKPEVPEDFLAALDTIRASAKTLIIMGVPRTRLYNEAKDNAAVRNDKMREWAKQRSAKSGGNVHFLDFDNLAHAENAPQATGSLNWHFQCFLDHAHLEEAAKTFGSLQGAWHYPGVANYSFPTVWTDDEVKCHDDMDRTLWQILFNLLCNRHAKHAAASGQRRMRRRANNS